MVDICKLLVVQQLVTDEPGEISTECYILAGVTGKVTQFVTWMAWALKDLPLVAYIVAAVAPVPEHAHRKPCLGFVSVLLCGVWAFQRYVFGSFPGESVSVTSHLLPSGL